MTPSLGALWRSIVGCAHKHCYRERRLLYGLEVLHLVCAACGHATPMVPRTTLEHRAALEAAKRAGRDR